MYTHEAQSKLVVKSNTMIQKSKFNLSTMEQRIILYLISKIKPYADSLEPFTFFIADFCKVCGINYASGSYYSQLRDAIKGLADKSIWLPTEEGGDRLFRWITEAETFPDSGMLKISLNKDLEPYLIHLRSNYTRYELIYTLKFRCKYTTRLFEFLKSVHYHDLESYQTRVYTLDEVRSFIGAVELDRKGNIVPKKVYMEWQPLKNRCLEPAIREINQYSDITVSYTTETRKREVIVEGKRPVVRSYVYGVKFLIETKDIDERIAIAAQIEKDFGLNQLTFDDDWNWILMKKK